MKRQCRDCKRQVTEEYFERDYDPGDDEFYSDEYNGDGICHKCIDTHIAQYDAQKQLTRL